MFVRQELWRHMKRCQSKPAMSDESAGGRHRVLTIAAVAKSAFSGQVDDGLMKVLSQMNDDEIARVVRNDFGLLQFAQSLYNRHGFNKTKHEYIRQKVRELARFILALRKKCPSFTLEDAMKPANFMNVIDAVKDAAGFNQDTHSYQTPSLALKIGHSLLKVSEILHCRALIAEDADLTNSAKAFQKLYKTKWSEYISHKALCTISDLKYNKPTKLPLTQDIDKLNDYLQRSAESAFQELSQNTTEHNYACLARLTLTRIILFNRRRVGEVSKMPLKNFLQRDDSYAFEELGLSAYEKRLCKYFTRVELKGKRGRKVAVLLSPDITKALELLGVYAGLVVSAQEPYCCSQCQTDFTRRWRKDKGGATMCEQCMSSNQKKVVKAEHTNRLKAAFVKALQQEQEILQQTTLSSSSSSSAHRMKVDPIKHSHARSSQPITRHPATIKQSPVQISRGVAAVRRIPHSFSPSSQLQNAVAAAALVSRPGVTMAYVNTSLSVQKSSSSSAERQREYLLDMIPSRPANVWK
ncbi:Transcriptional repressor p66-alpha [Triplophysa tibetana]|uniref:Transcriptional repressor p66-alpha n=1 Tax=Triplophysa tibetana TaxID=1572043 RepID=A0A5A9PC30_9TELE|nr:Transcriptional repressor p66-alpha [Triplophysa tibetana]